ncbi:MFS transporter [Cupriavidus sp. USMAA2-4]|uniref:MFS transporter n=1 Tax=Cupriavidus malaysiensis TaxID=367825 RepID=A0ABN4TYE2_9BURK|nr:MULTISPECIES: MFS transporter [Cupriavidus]AOY94501.1 MFS transporter [Cupriavidus sp. USMAA2-4]AOZ02638.1 MFS transporter [Cupriavidus sp. USMAHM13]AOZ09996.1 MFS transporter [Cupriavidus malaysiensis]
MSAEHAPAVPPRAAAAAGGQASLPRKIAAITIGNGLEFFDFAIYTYFATILGKQFFPASSPMTQLLLSLATFGIGFVVRPLGGIVIGSYADRAGRKAAMSLTLWLMAAGSAVFVVVPTYAQAGPLAPCLLVLGRLIQGFAVGGEVGASTSMLLEYAGPRNRGFFASWQLFSQALSTLLGSLVGLGLSAALSPAQLEAWGWRIPFLIGLALIPLGTYVRRHLDETHARADVRGGKAAGTPVMAVLRDHRRKVVLGVLMTAGATSSNYIALHYLTNYAVGVLKLPFSTGLWASLLAGALQMVLAAAAGMASDTWGRKRVANVARVLLLVAILPAFGWLSAAPGIGRLLAVAAILVVPTVFISVSTVTMITEVFPRAVRATGLSIVYGIGVSIFGGFAQFLSTWLIELTGSRLAPAWYVMALGVLALWAVTRSEEQAGRALD